MQFCVSAAVAIYCSSTLKSLTRNNNATDDLCIWQSLWRLSKSVRNWEPEWHSGESALLPPVCLGFNNYCDMYICWICLLSRVFPSNSGFPHSLKTWHLWITLSCNFQSCCYKLFHLTICITFVHLCCKTVKMHSI